MAKKKAPSSKPTRPRPPEGPGQEPVQSIHGVDLPELFHELWNSKRWRQPDQERVDELMPWLWGPLEFIQSMHSMRSASLGKLADFPPGSRLMRMYRGSSSENRKDLPWLDIEQAVVIAHNRDWGDDIGVALDYRSGTSDPRVVATCWNDNPEGEARHQEWIVVAETFSEFVAKLEL